MPLTRAAVVETATLILREYGLGDLTMRRLARELGVQPGALYWHVADKQDLLVAVTERLLAAVAVPDDAGPGERAAARLATRLAAALLPVPDAADVVHVALAWRPEAVTVLAAFEELAAQTGVGAGVVERRDWAHGALDLVLGAVATHQEGARAAAARDQAPPDPEATVARIGTAVRRWARP